MVGDKWSLLILRDIIIHKKSRFKDFKESKEKIATNILANRLKSLSNYGLIKKLDPTGTKKSTRYIATIRGIAALPIIVDLYLFSINLIDETILNPSQINIKEKITSNRKLFEETTIAVVIPTSPNSNGKITRLGIRILGDPPSRLSD